jgi:hypothetical protein
MILPIVQQASHFHPFQPFLANINNTFLEKRLCIGLSKHFLVILYGKTDRREFCPTNNEIELTLVP